MFEYMYSLSLSLSLSIAAALGLLSCVVLMFVISPQYAGVTIGE